MIDDKKIETAANNYIETEYARYNSGDVEEEMICLMGKDSFKEGAKWAINEFMNDLLHPAEEIPEQERPVLVVYKHGGYSIEYWKAYNISGQVNYWTLDITQWLYVDELFPKNGFFKL